MATASAHCTSTIRTRLPGINTRMELAEADRVARAKMRELMLAGVTIERPETVTIDPHVERRARYGGGAVAALLLGSTVIGEDCRIGAGASLESSALEDRVVVGRIPWYYELPHLDAGAHAGPFSRLRTERSRSPDARVGNFVELKNTHLGKGSRASTLRILGIPRSARG